MSFLKRYITIERVILLWGDVFLGLGAFYVALSIPGGHPAIVYFSESGAVAFTVSLLVCSFFVELYKCEKNLSKRELLFRVLTNILLSFLLLSGLIIWLPPVVSDRAILLMSLLSFGLFQWTWHAVYDAIASSRRVAKKVLILGTGKKARLLGDIINSGRYRYDLIGYVESPAEPKAVQPNSRLFHSDELFDLIQRARPHAVVASFGESRGVLPLKEMLTAKLRGIRVYDTPSFYELLTGKLLIEYINPSWLIFTDGFKIDAFTRICKSLSDKIIACIGLVLLSPLLMLVALIIKIETPGPAIFSQIRVGREGRPFTIYKFRTMVADAEKESGPQWAKQNDPRITQVGRLLRKTRIDEIPQLYNVLQGDLSIVGPRPERPGFVRQLEKVIPYYAERHFVNPGITGWAQINYPYGDSVEDALEKLRYDLYYMKHLSFWLDIYIILATLNVVIFQKGSR